MTQIETKIIGNKIVEARKKLNISQAQLAEKLFISAQAVGKWERGESMPDITTLIRLAEILGVDLNYFSKRSSEAEKTIEAPVNYEKSVETKREKRNWNMSRGNWENADFSGLNNLQEKFGFSNIKNCKFISSDMSGIVLKANLLDSSDFSSSDISNCKIEASQVTNNSFKYCSLKNAEFIGCHIKKCNFLKADFTNVSFKMSSFGGNTIEGAVLNSVSFNVTDISDIVFEGKIKDCAFEYCTFSKVIFKNATLVNCFFKCKSLKRIQFIDCQADRMTYEFLKNGKADLTGLTLITL